MLTKEIETRATEATARKQVIEINNLRKSFGNLSVLTDLTLSVFDNENLVVLGKSGSGKSVLIKCIVRLLRPDYGTIKVLGKDVGKLNSKDLGIMRQKIGFLFQSGALYDSMTIKQNLEFPLKRLKKHLSKKERDERIAEALENVGLSDTFNKMPSELSGGMRKRAGLARTIVVDPMIMLYDEPTTGLDPVTSGEISLLINDVKKKYKTSSIIITHDIECARATGDRVIMLKGGKVYLESDKAEFNKSADELMKAFLK